MKKTKKTETILKGNPLYNPISIENRYSRELRGLVKIMTKETKEEVLKLFRSPDAKEYFAMDASLAIKSRNLMNILSERFERLFKSHADKMARKMLGDVSEQSKASLNKSFQKLSDQITLKVSDMPQKTKDIFEASISENVDLIKSIPTQYLDKIKGAVNRSITGSGGIGPLQEEIKKYGGMTDRRARNISLDQTRKAYQSVNIERAKAAGIKKGIWIHTGGTKEPRHRHKEYNGKEFVLSEGAPVGDKNGNYVSPGEEIACRCTFSPVVDFGDL